MINARKAQISWFVVLGLVFLIMLALVSWLAYSTRFMSKKPQQLVASESELEKVKTYLESCEKELAENTLILIGNQGGKTSVEEFFEIDGNKVGIVSIDSFSSLEDISKDVASYIDQKLARTCMPETVTKKTVETSRPKTSITFNDKETVVETDWEVTLTFENNTKQGIDMIKFSLPLRMKLLHETVVKDLETLGTDLNFVNSLDKVDVKKISYNDKVLNVLVDHKSEIKNKPYKFFYVENF
ncbi:MAG: hypothetical protein Q8O03_08975 [Nanoarchaeota archaeon]|nr:hypothetical protein [Nanoarchaeota archaeon]